MAYGKQSSLAAPMGFDCSASGGPGFSKKGHRCSVQQSVKQDMHLVGTLEILSWDCAVLGTLEPISVNVAMHLGVWGNQGRLQIQRDDHCGVPGRDTWVKYCIKEGMLETSGPEMKDASASVL